MFNDVFHCYTDHFGSFCNARCVSILWVKASFCATSSCSIFVSLKCQDNSTVCDVRLLILLNAIIFKAVAWKFNLTMVPNLAVLLQIKFLRRQAANHYDHTCTSYISQYITLWLIHLFTFVHLQGVLQRGKRIWLR